MIYYVKRHDLKFDPEDSSNIIGEVSFNKFWPQLGWNYLQWLIEHEKTEYIEKIEIIDSSGKKHELLPFLDSISKLHIAK